MRYGSCHGAVTPGTGRAVAACPMNAGSVGAGPVFSIGTAGCGAIAWAAPANAVSAMTMEASRTSERCSRAIEPP